MGKRESTLQTSLPGWMLTNHSQASACLGRCSCGHDYHPTSESHSYLLSHQLCLPQCFQFVDMETLAS